MSILMSLLVPSALAADCTEGDLWFDGRCRAQSWFESTLNESGAELASVAGCPARGADCGGVVVTEVVDGALRSRVISEERIAAPTGSTLRIPQINNYPILSETRVTASEEGGALYLTTVESEPVSSGLPGIQVMSEQRRLSVGIAGSDVDVQACAVDADFEASDGVYYSEEEGYYYHESYCPEGGCLAASDGAIEIPEVYVFLDSASYVPLYHSFCRTGIDAIEVSVGYSASSGEGEEPSFSLTGFGAPSACLDLTHTAQVAASVCEAASATAGASAGTGFGWLTASSVGVISACDVTLAGSVGSEGSEGELSFECDLVAFGESYLENITTGYDVGSALGEALGDRYCPDFGSEASQAFSGLLGCEISACESASTAVFEVILTSGGEEYVCNAELSASCTSDGASCDCEAAEAPSRDNIDLSSCH